MQIWWLNPIWREGLWFLYDKKTIVVPIAIALSLAATTEDSGVDVKGEETKVTFMEK